MRLRRESGTQNQNISREACYLQRWKSRACFRLPGNLEAEPQDRVGWFKVKNSFQEQQIFASHYFSSHSLKKKKKKSTEGEHLLFFSAESRHICPLPFGNWQCWLVAAANHLVPILPREKPFHAGGALNCFNPVFQLHTSDIGPVDAEAIRCSQIVNSGLQGRMGGKKSVGSALEKFL